MAAHRGRKGSAVRPRQRVRKFFSEDIPGWAGDALAKVKSSQQMLLQMLLDDGDGSYRPERLRGRKNSSPPCHVKLDRVGKGTNCVSVCD